MLQEKIGQMLLVGFKGTALYADDPIVKAILARRVAGVILFAHNIVDAKQLAALTQQLQSYAQLAGVAPLLIGVDYEGGKVNRLKEAAGFPKTLSAAEMGLCTATELNGIAKQMASTLKQSGININFAPVVDVNFNPNNPVIGQLGRSFSSEARKVAEYAAIFSRAHQEAGVVCALKHFPGHGSSMGDTHTEFVDVTKTWQEAELEPYKQLLRQPAVTPMVMTAHVVHLGLDDKGYPASLSAAMTQQLLRDTLHFDGVVVTDDLQMRAVADHYALNEAVRLAVNAGADVLIFGNQLVEMPQDPAELVELIAQEVNAGHIELARIEEANRRVRQLKESILMRC